MCPSAHPSPPQGQSLLPLGLWLSKQRFLSQLLWARPLPGSGVSSGEQAGSVLSCHADLLQQLRGADERWKSFVASCCTLSASWSSGLSFLETKGWASALPALSQGWLCCGAGDVGDILCGCFSSVLQLPSCSVVTVYATAVTAESS